MQAPSGNQTPKLWPGRANRKAELNKTPVAAAAEWGDSAQQGGTDAESTHHCRTQIVAQRLCTHLGCHPRQSMVPMTAGLLSMPTHLGDNIVADVSAVHLHKVHARLEGSREKVIEK